MSVFRSIVAVLLIAFGLVILGRGLIEGAPLSFTGMGAVMAGLGIYQLRLILGYGRSR
jgi:hypothetical protein